MPASASVVLVQPAPSDAVAQRRHLAAFFRRAAQQTTAPETEPEAVPETEAEAAETAPPPSVLALLEGLEGIGHGTEPELQAIYNLLFASVADIKDPTEAQKAIDRLLFLLTKADPTDDKPSLRIDLLAKLFNYLPADSANRPKTYLALVRAAAETDQLESVPSALPCLDAWFGEWQCAVDAQADFLHQLIDIYSKDEKHDQAQLLSFEYLKRKPEDHQAITRTIATALRQPKQFDFSPLMANPTVRQATANADANAALPICQLLRIFTAGSLADFDAFAAKSQALLKENGLAQDQLRHKMTLVALTELVSQHISHDLSYQTISSSLSISEDEVEPLLIAGIRLNLIAGQISQLERVFKAQRAAHRTFDERQWQQLSQGLSDWRANLTKVISSISQRRE